MGSEDLFHKRKARKYEALQRRSQKRARNNRYLIVCEGTKTEPNYFREMLVDLSIPPYMVRIAENDGSSPNRVVSHALELYKADAESGDAYDNVYCVFDRDKHPSFDDAVQHTKDMSEPIVAITSTPCFEFWLLLHFGYTDSPFHAAGKKSVGDQVKAALMKKPGFERYEKGQSGVYKLLKATMVDAINHAVRLRTNSEVTGCINPATDVDMLVLKLIELTTNKDS